MLIYAYFFKAKLLKILSLNQNITDYFMYLKNIVDEILKDKARSLSWLAVQMGKTFDGLKLSLVKESLKYKDISEMAKILEVSPNTFFQSELPTYASIATMNSSDDEKGNTKTCKELVAALKDQIKDKEKIILLMSKNN
ncbi:hypothetical protein [Pedobacter sp. GR22-6]|uniref:hypothetical protein n=1 Tax=Pedobacter sp. GR22-6 TaxID=3127957 RepID=UPI00307E85F4